MDAYQMKNKKSIGLQNLHSIQPITISSQLSKFGQESSNETNPKRFQRSSSSSFQLPSDLDNENISDKEVDSFRQNQYNKNNRKPSSGNSKNTIDPQKNKQNQIQNVSVPGLDLSLPNQNKINQKVENVASEVNQNIPSQLLDEIHSPSRNPQSQKSSIPLASEIDNGVNTQGNYISNRNQKKNDPQTTNTETQNQDHTAHTLSKESKGGKEKNSIRDTHNVQNKAESSNQSVKEQLPRNQQSQYQQKKTITENILEKQAQPNNVAKFQTPNIEMLKGQNKQIIHKRGPSVISNQGPELTLDDDSYEREKYRMGDLHKEGAELFNDDSMVSAIQREIDLKDNTVGGLGDGALFNGEYEDEEDTSARKLVKDNMTPTDIQRRPLPPKLHQKQNSVGVGNNLQQQQSQSKDLINFVDQSKEDPYQKDQAFPIIKPKNGAAGNSNNSKVFDSQNIHQAKSQLLEYNKASKNNKVAPINLNNLTSDYINKIHKSKEFTQPPLDDYFQFEPNLDLKERSESKKRRNSRNPMSALLNSSSSNGGKSTAKFDFANSQLSKNKAKRISKNGPTEVGQGEIFDENNLTDPEQSLLLDESVLRKELDMPNALATREQLQYQIGHKIQKENVRFHDELEGLQNDDSFYRIMDKDSIEIVDSYYDKCPCLGLRKFFMRARVYIQRTALAVITNSIFETVSVLVICTNSLFLALDDPLATTPAPYTTYSDIIFQALYSTEMVLKIIALGFILGKGSYLRDSWNILDFVIVSSGFLNYIMSGSTNLSVLRSFRVIRPLRTISSIQGLRVIVQSLISALPLLRDTILVLMFFFLIFGIAGVQLFVGTLKLRCFWIETGLVDSNDTLCSTNTDCLSGQYCGKSMENPNYGTTNFDNVLYAILQVFQTITLEGWTPNMEDQEITVGTWTVVYFIPIVFIGAFFLLNLTLAVIKSKFTEEMHKKKANPNMGKKKKIKKKEVDDDSEPEEQTKKMLMDENDEQREKRIKERIEAMTIQQIDDDPTISPEQRRQIKQKRRLEDLIKKMEIALKQKEVRDKITPRDGTNESFRYVNRHTQIGGDGQDLKTGSQTNTQLSIIFNHQFSRDLNDFYNQNNGKLSLKQQTRGQGFSDKLDEISEQEQDLNSDMKNKNGQYIKGKTILQLGNDNTIKEDDDESHDLTVLLDKDDYNNKKIINTDGNMFRSENTAIKKIANNSNIITGVRGRVPRNRSGQKQPTSAWLGKVFELENSRENSSSYNKVVMGGFAGIKNSKMMSSYQKPWRIKHKKINRPSNYLKNSQVKKEAKNQLLIQNLNNIVYPENSFQFQLINSHKHKNVQFIELLFIKPNKIDDEKKKRAYEKLQQNFDIFQFLDSSENNDEDQYGDDELSSNEYEKRNPKLVQQIIEDLDDLENINGHYLTDKQNSNASSNNNINTNQLERKTTITTSEAKSLTKRYTLDKNTLKDDSENLDPIDSKRKVKLPSETTNQKQLLSKNLQLKLPGTNVSNRRKSVMPKLSLYKHKFEEDDSDEDKDSSSKNRPGDSGSNVLIGNSDAEIKPHHSRTLSADTKQRKNLTFKEKALAFFRISTKKNRKKDLQNQSQGQRDKSNDKILNETIQNFKEMIMRKRSSKSQPRQSSRGQGTVLSPGELDATNILEKNATFQTGTVRAKSEYNKQKQLHKETIKFQQRQQIMKKKRNIFFAQSIKSIGKTKADMKKEFQEKILKKRFIQLGGGFELPPSDSPSFKKYRRRLMRSGTMLKDPTFTEQTQNLDIDDGNTTRKNSFIDQEIYNEVKKVRDELDQQAGYEEDVPDMEAVLQMKKKKISLKMKNYKYTSIDDIFERRNDDEMEELNKLKTKVSKDIIAPILPAVKKMGASNAPAALNVKGFQKKIILMPKRFHEDLEDIRDSDDNQDEALKKLEEKYNQNLRSDIYVTGTLSIVFDKPKHENKMMNPNYYYNIHPENYHLQASLSQGVQSQFSKDGIENSQSMNFSRIQPMSTMNHKNIFVSNFGEPERLESKESIYDNNLSVGSIGNASLNRSQNSVKNSGGHKRANSSNLRNSLNTSRMSGRQRTLAPALNRKKTMRSQFSNAINNSQQKRSGSAGIQQSGNTRLGQTVIYQQVQRPEPLNDRQILRRLNNNLKSSKVFNSVNFTKLPDVIRHKKGEEPPPKKKAKKQPHKNKPKTAKQKLEEEEENEEISDTSNDSDQQKEDYYLDRDLDNEEEILRAKNTALVSKIDAIEWSGQDVMQKFDPYKARLALASFSKIRTWPYGLYGYVKRWRTLLKKIMKGTLVGSMMTAFVFMNTIILSLDHYGIDDSSANTLQSFNTAFTFIFAIEMFLKITAIGIKKYLRDKMNYMDGSIVLLSLVELIFMSGSGAFSAFRSIRMLRTLRVLRVARLLRSMKSMINIISVIQRSIKSFMYLGILLFLFLFIYALLGMQLFGGNLNEVTVPRYTFDSFNMAFVVTFDLLTVENWNNTLFNCFGSTVNKGIIVLYFISCIFIGNYMLLNLFLAILLDAFTSVDDEDHDTPQRKAERALKQIQDLNDKEGQELIYALEEIEGQSNSNDHKKKKKKKKRNHKSKKEEMISNILDESIEADLETLEQRKKEIENQKQKLFDGIECERSIYVFTKENRIRKFCYLVVHDNRFENFILVIIILSSIKLVFDTYYVNAPATDPVVLASSKLDLVFTSLFTCECVLKVVAFGFVQDQNSYLRETWSKMDFFIVVTSLIDASFASVNIGIIKILRLLRILRPLRFISHNSSMKTVVVALLSSMGAIANVGVVIVCIFLMFSILGVNLFAGKLQWCSVNKYEIPDRQTCFQNRGDWITYNQHFDNVLRGMLTLFVLSNQEGWPDVMYNYTDITGVNSGPKPAAAFANAYFFVAFLCIGNFFLINLFVGVLFMNFEAAQRDEKEAMLLESSEIKWVDMMKMITDAKPEIIKIPKNRISKAFYKFTKPEGKFDFFVMCCIILNMFQMAMTFEGMSVSYSKGLDYANYFFTAVFTLEATFKLIGNGTAYFYPGWHKFDFFVVTSSYADIVMSQLSANSLKPLKVAPQIARVLRVLRVSRLFRLLNKYRGLQALLQTITFSLPSLMNVFALLMLVYFIFAILGVFLFNNITTGNILDPVYFNFSDFSHAMIILLRMSTGEDWPTIMYDTMITSSDCIPGQNCGVSYSPAYFVVFIIIQQYIMLNLFVLIILQQFELYYLPDDNILQQFRDDLQRFKMTWIKYSAEFTGIKVQANDLVPFFRDLQGKLSFGNATESEILRNLVKMNLESDEEGFIYFNEMLFKTMKRVYGTERTRKRILIDFELQTLEKLQKIKDSISTKDRKEQRIRAVTVNPFLAVMYKNMSFKAWLKIFRTNLSKREEEIEYGLDRDSSEDELESNRMVTDDYEYFYETEDDLPCDSDDENFDIDSSQKNLIQERSIYGLIKDVNGIVTPTSVTIPGQARRGVTVDSNRSGVGQTTRTNQKLNQQKSMGELHDPNPLAIANLKNHALPENHNPDKQDSQRDQGGFKIKLQQTMQQKPSNLNVDSVVSPQVINMQSSSRQNPDLSLLEGGDQFQNGGDDVMSPSQNLYSPKVQSQFSKAAQVSKTSPLINQRDKEAVVKTERQPKHNLKQLKDEQDYSSAQIKKIATNPFLNEATTSRLLLNNLNEDDENMMRDLENQQNDIGGDGLRNDGRSFDEDDIGDGSRIYEDNKNFNTQDYLNQE